MATKKVTVGRKYKCKRRPHMYKYKVIKEGVETRGVISKDEKGKPIVTMTEVPVVYLIRMMADDEKAKGKRSLTVFRDAFLRDYSMTA